LAIESSIARATHLSSRQRPVSLRAAPKNACCGTARAHKLMSLACQSSSAVEQRTHKTKREKTPHFVRFHLAPSCVIKCLYLLAAMHLSDSRFCHLKKS
jgi:hypothetical protein